MSKFRKGLIRVFGVLGIAVDYYGLGSIITNYAHYLMKAIDAVGPAAWSLFLSGVALGLMDVLRVQLGARFNLSFIGCSLMAFSVILFQPFSFTIASDIFVILIWTIIFTLYPWRRGPMPSSFN